MGLFGVACEFAGDRDDFLPLNAGDLFGPGGGVGAVVVEILGHPVTAKTPVETVVGAEEVENGGNQRLGPVGKFHTARWNVPGQHFGVIAFHEIARGRTAEIREVDAYDLIVIAIHDLAEAQLAFSALRFLFEVPSSLFAPAEPDGPVGRHDLTRRLVIGDGLPVGVVGLAQLAVEVVGAQHPARHHMPVLFVEPNEHRHVRVLAGVLLEILGLPVEVEFAQDHVTHRHCQRRVGARLRVQPDVAELGGFRIVGADHGRLGAAIADLGVEMRVRRARLRHVRAPEHQEARVVPVGRFRHVGLFAPGLGGSRRQVAVPVVERHAGAAQKRQVA